MRKEVEERRKKTRRRTTRRRGYADLRVHYELPDFLRMDISCEESEEGGGGSMRAV